MSRSRWPDVSSPVGPVQSRSGPGLDAEDLRHAKLLADVIEERRAVEGADWDVERGLAACWLRNPA